MIVGKRIDRINCGIDIVLVIRERCNKIDVIVKVDDAELCTAKLIGDISDVFLYALHSGVAAVVVLSHHAESVIDNDNAVAIELLSVNRYFIGNDHGSQIDSEQEQNNNDLPYVRGNAFTLNSQEAYTDYDHQPDGNYRIKL